MMGRPKRSLSAKQIAEYCQMAARNLDRKINTGEKKFQNALFNILKTNQVDFDDEVPLTGGRNSLQGTIIDPTRDSGEVDFVIAGKIGIEIKILFAPKKFNLRSESKSIYDLGQITMDIARLKSSKQLKKYVIILFIKGHHLKDYNTAAELRRYIHNRLFIDFTNCCQPGREFHPSTKFFNSNLAKAYQVQKKIAIHIGLGNSYSTSSPIRAASVKFSDKFAVVVWQVF